MKTNKVYLIQADDTLIENAIQNAIIIAPNKKEAVSKFRKELADNEECDQVYDADFFKCQRLDLKDQHVFIQYGGDTFQFSEVEREEI